MSWQMTSADDVADDITRADVRRRKQARTSAWRRVEVREGSWRHVAARGARDQPYRNFQRHVGACTVSDDVESFTVL